MFSVWPCLSWSSGDCKRRCSGLSAFLAAEAVNGSFALGAHVTLTLLGALQNRYSFRQASWAGSCSNTFAPFRPCSPRAGLWLGTTGSASLPFLAWEGGGCQLPLWHGWQQKAGSHLPSLPAAKCRLFPFSSCSGWSPTVIEHSGSTGPWWLSLILLPRATSSNTHYLGTVTSAHPFPRGVNESSQSGFLLRAKALVLLFPGESWGSLHNISSLFLIRRTCPSLTPNF